ncbi:hypothetical protein CTEN210_16952 [Chaetoceros tenuissimus]|uniref:Leucine-rich repeat domain-containing protein n=1 Tax=Chaetoceros tenuissimus TaxID=426638 RepID=A0AAD3D9P7_9STRA|nr:hypothetical protein CTEN210_16952 [Chaetoceros tenuissimus]
MGVAIVDGLVTLFYDGSRELFDDELHWGGCGNTNIFGDRSSDWQSWSLSEECREYIRERLSWQQIIIADGVTEIPDRTFYHCRNIKQVIFADTVVWVGNYAFSNSRIYCNNLSYIKLPPTLEYIGTQAFRLCDLLSVFIPPSCTEIDYAAFTENSRLTYISIPQNTEISQHHNIIAFTELFHRSPFMPHDHEEVNLWLKSINANERFALHRVCSSFRPTLDMILQTMVDKGGPHAFKVENNIDITPSRYLKENPYVDVTEKDVIEKYILQMMGESQIDS